MTLLRGGVAIPGATFNYNAPDGIAAFVGVWTDFAFDGAEIIDVTNTIDNELQGELYTRNPCRSRQRCSSSAEASWV